MKTPEQRTTLRSALFDWSTLQLQADMSVNGFKISNCNRSGSIFLSKEEKTVYLNYDHDLSGDVLSGYITRDGEIIGAVSEIDCSNISTLDDLSSLYLATVKRVTEYL